MSEATLKSADPPRLRKNELRSTSLYMPHTEAIVLLPFVAMAASGNGAIPNNDSRQGRLATEVHSRHNKKVIAALPVVTEESAAASLVELAKPYVSTSAPVQAQDEEDDF